VLSSRLLWANLSSSAKGSSFKWANASICSAAILLAANDIGPYGSLVWWFIVCLMGQCKLIGLNIIVHAIGPCKGLHKMSYCTACCGPTQAHQQEVAHSKYRANSSICSTAILLEANCIGPHASLMQRSIVYFMGQCKLIAQILSCIQLAHVSACAQCLILCQANLSSSTRAVHFQCRPT